MKANFLGQGTGDATIGLDENENFLTLSLVLPYDMNYKMFKDALEDFVNYLDYWKEELIRHKKAAELISNVIQKSGIWQSRRPDFLSGRKAGVEAAQLE